jgi:ABC-type Fe3+/spermidine/putrescine transport system ATPase subunit
MLSVRGVGKRFGTTTALDDVSLEVGNETVAILGPSGCGKSTLLRVIAGLQRPDTGRVLWNDTDITDTAVHLRDFGLMFQSFALFPHRTVGQNVSFGLEMRDVSGPERARRVGEALEWVGMIDLADRKIDGLSGGEKQRVALARTLAPRPRLVMFDEPLGSLDRLIRDRLLDEIRDLLDETATPAIYVTHDHDEARTIAGRIALMRSGRIIQQGTWRELTSDPADEWVARFLGA